MLKNLFRQLLRPRSAEAPPIASVAERLGAALGNQQRGLFAEAEAAYRSVLAATPGDAEVLHLLASNLMLQGRNAEAVTLLDRVTALQPQCVEAFCNLAGALNAMGKHPQAVLHLERALALRPDFAEAWNNLGNTLQAAGMPDEAERAYRCALELRPAFAEGAYNLGNLLHLEGRIAEAIECYRSAIAIKPSFVTAHSNYVYALNFDPGWEPQRVFEEHLAWARIHAESLRTRGPAPANEASPGRRLRIGYVSPNFRNHAAAYFFEPVLACHDTQWFQVFCYSDVIRADDYTARLKRYGAEWRECAQLADDALAERIRQDKIDILVDLTGHTERNRLLVFARKPAPVQVTWNGYANTTGMSAMDYRITDALADPPGMTEHLHTETLIRMPESYMVFRPPGDSPAVNDLPAALSGRVTFGSFNALSKITPRVVHAWSSILVSIPGARLVMATVPAGSTRERMVALFTANGVDPSRVELYDRLPFPDFLALHHRADIALDAFPFSGTTTTCHSLWMGLPVVTLAGKSHVARVGVSMLTNVGLTGMIANSVEEYVKIAIGLAQDLERLNTMRRGLRDRMRNSPLTDARRFTRQLEDRLRQIWAAWCSRQPATEKAPAP